MMTCVNCGNNSAQLYERMVGGKESTLCLCPACYRKLYPEGDAIDLFTQFLGNTGGRRSKACPSCGTTLGDFRKTGLVGCAECYDAFRDDFLPSIRYIQRDVVHRGKQPNEFAGTKYDMVRELVQEQARVRLELDKAMLDEDFRRAKELKARLRQIEANLMLAGRSS